MGINQDGLKYVTLHELKLQMRVDFEEEDEIIRAYGRAAEDAIIRGTGRSETELLRFGFEEKTGELPTEGEILGSEHFPSRLKVAILMFAANLYRNREPVASVAQNAVPYSFDVLVKPYKKLGKPNRI